MEVSMSGEPEKNAETVPKVEITPEMIEAGAGGGERCGTGWRDAQGRGGERFTVYGRGTEGSAWGQLTGEG